MATVIAAVWTAPPVWNWMNMRQLPAHQHTPFILLTAKCMEIDFIRLQEKLGVSKALPKPFSPSELIVCIEEALAVGCKV